MPFNCPVITIRNRHLFRGEERFIVRGVVYQPRRPYNPHGSFSMRDPITDHNLKELRRDKLLFLELGINALYVYKIEPTAPHDQAMKLLAAAGIYVLITTTSPRITIRRSQPRESYTEQVKTHFRDVTDCMSSYSNVIAVCISNCLINSTSVEMGLVDITCDVLVTAIFDLKQHMLTRNMENGQRILPVGVSDDQYSMLHTSVFARLTDPNLSVKPHSDSIDLYCFTFYQHNQVTKLRPEGPFNIDFKDVHLLPKFSGPGSSLPVLVSEYSEANNIKPRPFAQVSALYSTGIEGSGFLDRSRVDKGKKKPYMSEIFSGGFLYEYTENANQYGVVKEKNDGTVEKLADFNVFVEKLRNAIPISH